jgi:hypothetical protein
MIGGDNLVGDSGQQPSNRSEPNHLEEVFTIAIDLWTKSAAAWLSANGMGKANDAGGAPSQMSMGAVPPLTPSSAAYPVDWDGFGELHAASRQIAFMSTVVAQAWMVIAGGALRYGQSLAEVHARRQGALVQAAAGRASGETAGPLSGSRVLADQLRAYLREIGDSASLEVRRLQAELEAIGEQIAEAAAPTGSVLDSRERRHRVKP